MLRNTFCHLPGVAAKTERKLWERGVYSWDDYIVATGTPVARFLPSVKECVEESMERLEARDPGFFARGLSAKESWRLFADFRDSIAYLDIETNGYVGPTGYITAISVYDGKDVKYYVKGQNLGDFKRDMARFKVVVTYNGKCFDIPFIERDLNVRMPKAHIDLRYILRDLGFSGGLKGCERQLGINRGALDGVDGYFAVLLWYDFKKNKNQKALETLLAYNIQDVVNLEPLLVAAYNMKLRNTPFQSTHSIAAPHPPESQFTADVATIRRISESHPSYAPVALR